MRIFLLVIVISVGLLSCKQENKEVKTIEDIKSAFTLSKMEVGKALKLPAELLPYERAEINAKLEGYVQKVMVDIGDKVKKGQYLAILDAPEVVAQHAEASAKYHEAEARYISSLDRYTRIFTASRQQGVVAEGELFNTKHQMLADSAALNSANSTAQAYKQMQAYLTIKAPFDGIVTSRSIDPGDLVGSSGKTNLFTVERPDKLRLRVYVPESFVNSIPAKEGMTFTADAVLNRTFSAELARKSGSINTNTRTELWEYEYDNKNGDLKPGMYAMAQLHLNRPANSFVVPFSALVTSLEKKFVVRVKDNQVEWVDVREGISQGNGVEIFGELEEGDTLLTRGSEEIKPGTTVRVKIDN